MTTLSSVEITAWLNNESAIRGTLIEVDVLVSGVETTRYLSTFPYTTAPTDTPANTYYDPIVSRGVSYTESMDYTGSGSGSMLAGDIELNNFSGEYDSWLNDVWTNRNIRAYIGDVSWTRDKFIQILDGVLVGIDSKNPNVLNLKIREKLQRLNTPISEINYSDIYPYPDHVNTTPHYDPSDPNSTVPDVFMPHAFGEVHNITPVLIDPARVKYSLSYMGNIGVIEVRDNGIPLREEDYEVDTARGILTLKYLNAGTITVSLRGSLAYSAPSLIKNLVQYTGKVVPNPVTGGPTTRSTTNLIPNTGIGFPIITPSPDRFVDGVDIDSANFDNMISSNSQVVGLFVSQKENLLSTCQALAASIGASMVTTRSGKLRLVKLASPPTGTPFVIDTSMYKYNSLQIIDRTEILGAIKLGFNKNWTVQKELKTNIPPKHKEMFAEEWSTVSVFNPTALSQHKLTGLPVVQNTHLQVLSDANVEANRRLQLWSQQHTVYKISGFSPLLDLQIGDTVQLVGPRYGLTGALGIGLGTVVMLQPNWTTATVEVGIFI
jgi:hypothetical protein